MPFDPRDKRRVKLTPKAARKIKRSSEQVLGRPVHGPPPRHKYRHIFEEKGGQDSITFKVISADTENCKVTAEVMARPCGVSKVKHEDENEQVTIYDIKGCLLDEDDDDLVDRIGDATLVVLKYGSGLDCDGSIPEEECIWRMDNLCCPDPCN